jgi:uncharacterized iron-regulated membrane protein
MIVHRWAGLTIVFALVVTGLTGAVLPFQREISHWIASDVWSAQPPHPGAQMLSGVEVMRRVQEQTGGEVNFMSLDLDPAHTQSVFVSLPTADSVPEYRQVFADPYTGDLRAMVRYGDLRDGAVNIMPFVINVHYTLAAGAWGRWLMGVAALIWAVECVIGFILSLPRVRTGGLLRVWQRWVPAWGIRRGRGSEVFTQDMHRAAGLWLWPVMLVFAWSAVAFNLDGVHTKVQAAFGAQGLYRSAPNPDRAEGQAMTSEAAVQVGARLMAQEAARRGFTVHKPQALSINSYDQTYGYYARTSLDGPAEDGSTALWFDQVSGRLLEFRPPYGTTAADAVDMATRSLHTARIFGWPYKICVSLFGLATAAMAIAGLLCWLRRGRVKRERASKRAQTA